MTTSTYVWRRLDLDGRAFVRLDVGSDGVSAAGYEICAEGDQRWAVRFSIELDAEWRHERTTVEVMDEWRGASTSSRTAPGRGCAVAGPTPSGGLYGRRSRRQPVHERARHPSRRRRSASTSRSGPGTSRRPRCRCDHVQRYQRLAADRWVYADDEYGRFELSTDADGVAVDYEQLAERARRPSEVDQ